MPDIRLLQSPEAFPKYQIPIDWSLLQDGTLDDTQALVTAVVVALGTDRLASATDILPDPDSTDRAGWWGDMDAEELFNGWPIGTKLWLLKRAKIVGPEDPEGATITRVEQYISEALQPFVTHKICTSYDVEAWRVDKQQIDALVVIYRGPTRPVEMRFQVLWNEYDIERA
ncbi:phage GP46 family protein [Bradyrhizobium sp. SRL28]|uniref:phage GP46 family protein n=1 Tax=Bradyrhizobium sp. SRL28 TaxID=2836178 RepID=UPI001BDECB5B|nr:phage GP46 family protein [Bradyrhizobium sp. SRL28]MBT1509399.1 phage GP46 family protein [Bradyrhizobium sp. SRL28]